MHIWLVELKFAILFLLNAHFERILTILLHFLERVPDRPNFSVLPIFTLQPCVKERTNTQCEYFILKKTEDDKGFPKRFSD